MLPLALIALAGCGESAPAPKGDRPLVATLGDSITEGAPYGEPQFQKALEFGYEVRACGVSGERTDQIAQRLDECAEGADILLVQGGINDIAQGRPVRDAADDLQAMVRRGKEKGLRVLLVDVLPWNNGHPQADAAVAELNERIARIAEEESVAVIGFHDTLEDPANPGTMKPEFTSDGDHPSQEGYARLGAVIELE